MASNFISRGNTSNIFSRHSYMYRQEALKIAKEFDNKKLEKSIIALHARLLKHIGQAENRVCLVFSFRHNT